MMERAMMGVVGLLFLGCGLGMVWVSVVIGYSTVMDNPGGFLGIFAWFLMAECVLIGALACHAGAETLRESCKGGSA